MTDHRGLRFARRRTDGIAHPWIPRRMLLLALAFFVAAGLSARDARAQGASAGPGIPLVLDPAYVPETPYTFGNPAGWVFGHGWAQAGAGTLAARDATGGRYEGDAWGGFVEVDSVATGKINALEGVDPELYRALAPKLGAVYASDGVDLRSTSPSTLHQTSHMERQTFEVQIPYLSIGTVTLGQGYVRNSVHELNVEEKDIYGGELAVPTPFGAIAAGYASGSERIKDIDSTTKATLSQGTRPVDMSGALLLLSGYADLEWFNVNKANYTYLGNPYYGRKLTGEKLILFLPWHLRFMYVAYDLTRTGNSNVHAVETAIRWRLWNFLNLSASQTESSLASTTFYGFAVTYILQP